MSTELTRLSSLAVHMDGSPFANALVRLGTTPAQLTWQSGLDALSNDCLAAENCH
jgi:threonine aldolase